MNPHVGVYMCSKANIQHYGVLFLVSYTIGFCEGFLISMSGGLFRGVFLTKPGQLVYT